MKHHRYDKERIASFLTTYKLNPSAISQRWKENKLYSLDEERISNFRKDLVRKMYVSHQPDKLETLLLDKKPHGSIKIYNTNIFID